MELSFVMYKTLMVRQRYDRQEIDKCIKFVVGKPTVRLGRDIHGCDDNIKIDIRETWSEDVDRIHLNNDMGNNMPFRRTEISFMFHKTLRKVFCWMGA